MKPPVHSPPPARGERAAGRGVLLALCLAALLGLVAIGGESLWIDEAHSAVVAMAPDVAGWWRTLLGIPSDVQLAGYLFQLWVWEKLAGGGEWALRLNNYPWFLASLFVWVAALPRRFRAAMALCLGLSPFLWYYAGELRPYMMLFCGSSLMAAALVRGGAAGWSRGWFHLFGLGVVVALAASSAAIPWVGAATLAAVVLVARAKPRPRVPWEMLGSAVLPAAGLLVLAFWSFLHGARASSPEPGSLASLLFAPYELLGFAGLGPGRAALRGTGVAALGSLPFLLPLGLLALTLAAVAVAGVRCLAREMGWRRLGAGAALFALPVVAVVALGFYSGLRTTGRHFTPGLALLLPVLACGIRELWERRSQGLGLGWGRLVVVGFFLCWAASALELRTAARHRRDDYREAAAMARRALDAGREVWWLADPAGAAYYRLPLREEGAASGALVLANPESLPASQPSLVVYSRPDVYDNHSVVARMLARERYHPVRPPASLQGFSIWEKPPEH